jgi:sugar phosphate isomerase/epimerase
LLVRSVAKRQFGISTRVYQSQRLSRDHLLEIAAHGFECVEVAAAAGHFDPANERTVGDLQQWLAEARLVLHAVAAPAPDSAMAWSASALAPVEQALFVARRIPVAVLVLPVGPMRDAAKSVERLAPQATPLGVTIAVDSRSPSMSPVGSLVHFVERADVRLGIALDFAGAARGGGLVDAIEMASEHLVAARTPADGTIDWSSAMTTVQKVGYDGPFVVDVAAAGSTRDMLARARAARERMERWLTSI